MGQPVVLELKLWLRLEHAVENRPHPDAVSGSENGPEVVIAPLVVTPLAPYFELLIDFASQRRVGLGLLRD